MKAIRRSGIDHTVLPAIALESVYVLRCRDYYYYYYITPMPAFTS